MNSKLLFFSIIDKKFEPQAYALSQSLQKFNFKLLLVSVGSLSTFISEEENIQIIRYEDIVPISIINKLKDRSSAEFVSSITPFIFRSLLQKLDYEILTYLDADIFFYNNPKVILNDFIKSYSSILITKHNFEKIYDSSKRTGEFCVQFISAKKNKNSIEILSNWSDQCIEWCYYKFENGKFGDQKYLDDWPKFYKNAVYIVENPNFCLAPWNINKFFSNDIVFYHFHSLRILSSYKILMVHGYYLNYEIIENIYKPYLKNLDFFIRKSGFEISQYKIDNLIIRILKSIKFFFQKKIFNFALKNPHLKLWVYHIR